MPLSIPFDNTYARLPARLYHRQPPAPVRAPALLALNASLARQLGLDPAALATDAGLAVLAGNSVPEGAAPLAQVYAGHQFGSWNPQLGDGRALLLGEVIGEDGRRRDIQLKGSGLTPFSRMGDGRAWIGPVLREYLVSEAMAALGIPTTRALAAVATGEPVLRERAMPGAVLTRVAASHVRVGTFQYFAARGDEDAVRCLTDHVISRHYPEASDALGLLRAVVAAQASLVAQWLGVGFVHGVMNTDNMSVAGETIDYGPCAFMDVFAADRVFSSIDHFGRYAYARQPQIAAWNLAQFATCLLPLIDADPERAVAAATEAVQTFPDAFASAWLEIFRAKLGLRAVDGTDAEADGDAALINDLLAAMQTGQADFTITFIGLADDTAESAFVDPAPLSPWRLRYDARLARQGGPDRDRMAHANPQVIPRNHLVEAALAAAVAGEMGAFERLHAATCDPFATTHSRDFTAPPETPAEGFTTFCGT